ncbi:microfibril-associated glycoprotein 4-like [Saccostrea cucullata]|uniref:microfibril-associated glycoprotein 4-like n=1 Tax=Saccostrea cuccullata TaxID=36930 RepID=UPI002ED33479
MSSLRIVCFIVFLFTVSSATISSLRYTAKLELDNKMSNEELIGHHEAQSLSECAATCQRDRGFFGYNPTLKKCRTHKKTFTTGMSDDTGWRYYFPAFLPSDCKELRDNDYDKSDVYDIYPYGTKSIPVKVHCNMDIMGGGWTAIQKRFDGSVSFDRNWTDYKNGFGEPEQEVWIGNDLIHQLTKENTSSLYVTITLQNGTTLYEMYGGFSVSDEAGKYQIFLAGPATGTLGDSMLATGNPTRDLSGMFFSTPGRENDSYSGNCAGYSDARGGWWFNYCHQAFLNGPWSPGSWFRPWYPTVTSGTSVKATTLMVRRN